MSNLNEARRLLEGSPGHPTNEARVRRSTAHSPLSIAESLEEMKQSRDDFLSKMDSNSDPYRDGPEVKMWVICCDGNPVGRCGLCGCVGATEFFSRVLCQTHRPSAQD